MRAARRTAQGVVRAWVRDVDGGALEGVGHAAIRASADAVMRLAGVAGSASAGRTLEMVENAASLVLARPSPTAKWWQRRRRTEAQDGPSPDALRSLTARLDMERDEGGRRFIALSSAGSFLVQAHDDLKEALRLVDALAPAIEAGVREVRSGDPLRAALIEERGSALVVERREALLTQLVVHRQAMATSDLLLLNQQTLNAALEQARTATLSALQLMAAARRATGDAAALADSVGLARARSTLDEALLQARSALRKPMPLRIGRSTLDL